MTSSLLGNAVSRSEKTFESWNGGYYSLGYPMGLEREGESEREKRLEGRDGHQAGRVLVAAGQAGRGGTGEREDIKLQGKGRGNALEDSAFS